MTADARVGRRDLEALRRLAAAGSRAAAAAVGGLMGCEVTVEEVESRDAHDGAELAALAGPGETVAVGMELEGPLAGRLLLFVGSEDAERIASRLVPAAPAGSLDAVGESAIVEAGNIAGSAFVSALASRLGGRILHRVPRLARGAAGSCLGELVGRPSGPAAAARFACSGAPGVRGLFLFLPDAALLRALEAA
jgi:chemotaxis protein CheC